MGRRVLVHVHVNARDSTSELGRFLHGTSCDKGTCDIYWCRYLNLDSLSSINISGSRFSDQFLESESTK